MELRIDRRSASSARRIASLLSVLALVARAAGAGELPRLTGTVVGIGDGDTVEVRLQSGMVRVRLHGIDAPEHDQPYGRAAKRELSQLVYRKEVELEPIEQDRYDRLVARVWLDGTDVNAVLVQRGAAWVYRRYATEAAWCAYEKRARDGAAGLWALPAGQQVAPWEWRRRDRLGGQFTDYSRQRVAECVASLRK
jgi:endonuclease YncB( thermonuclease family)